MKRSKKNAKGFTLVELLVVMAIIGILAAILIPNMTGFIKTSKIRTANANAKIVHSAATAYVTDCIIAGNTATGDDGSGAGTGTKLEGYLDAGFSGNWAYVLIGTSDSVDYALWSDATAVGSTQLSSADQEDQSSNAIIGCYPLA